MKKFLIGCGVFCLILFVLFAGIVTFGVIKTRNYVNSVKSRAEALQQVEKDFPFSEPKSFALDATRFEEYFGIHAKLTSLILANPFVQKARESDKPGQKVEPSFSEAMTLLTLVQDVMETSGGELRRHKMSTSEYFWHTKVLLLTLKAGAKSGDPEFAKAEKEVDKLLKLLQNQLATNPQFKDVNFQLDANGTKREVSLGDVMKQSMDEQAKDTATSVDSIPPENIELVRKHIGEIGKEPTSFAMEWFMLEIWKESMRQHQARVAQRQAAGS